MTISTTRSALYTTARLLGDAQAIDGGTVVERIVRRLVGRALSGLIP